METKQELFERFGKLFIERVRDWQMGYIDAFVEQRGPLAAKYKAVLDTMSPEQKEILRSFATLSVDSALHDLLFVLEDADWIHLRLESGDTVLEAIRRAKSGDLQGYLFIWGKNTLKLVYPGSRCSRKQHALHLRKYLD